MISEEVFFDEKVALTIEDIVSHLHNGFFEVSYNSDHRIEEIINEEIKEQTIKKRLEGWNRVKNEVPKLKKQLEHDFRELLGGSLKQ